MEAAQRNGARNLESPPNRRVDFEECDFELEDGWLDLGGGHKGILSSKEPGIVETVLATVVQAQLGSASIGVRTPPDSTAHAGWTNPPHWASRAAKTGGEKPVNCGIVGIVISCSKRLMALCGFSLPPLRSTTATWSGMPGDEHDCLGGNCTSNARTKSSRRPRPILSCCRMAGSSKGAPCLCGHRILPVGACPL